MATLMMYPTLWQLLLMQVNGVTQNSHCNNKFFKKVLSTRVPFRHTNFKESGAKN